MKPKDLYALIELFPPHIHSYDTRINIRLWKDQVQILLKPNESIPSEELWPRKILELFEAL